MTSNYGNSFANVVRQLRVRRRWTQAQLAEQIGVTQATVSRWESADQDPEWEHMKALYELSGHDILSAGSEGFHLYSQVQILGDLGADVTVANRDLAKVEQPRLEIPPHPKHGGKLLFARRVHDRSVDLFFPPGTIILFVDPKEYGEPIVDGSFLLVEITNEDEEFEISLRQVETAKGGDRYLWYRSSEPRLGHGMKWPDPAPDWFRIKGVCVGHLQYD